MLYILETQDNLDRFFSSFWEDIFIHIIPINNNYHPILNKICMIYLRPLKTNKGYIIPINTEDAFNVDITKLIDYLNKIPKIWVIDKKNLLYYLNINDNVYDIEFLNIEYEIPELSVYNYFYNKFPNKIDINKLIPLTKHYEYCEIIFKQVEQYIPECVPKWYQFYNKYASLVFYSIEKNGICIVYDKIQTYFKINPEFSIKNNKIYNKYNLYNNTSRPSNSFNGINFLALNHKYRDAFIPTNDIFLEFDYSSYHIRLLSKLINYEIPIDENAHIHIGKQYFKAKVLTDEQYKQIKEINFKVLYNIEILEKYKHVDFFKQVIDYFKIKLEEYNNNGYILSNIAKKPIKNITSNTQLLPYILQSYETELGIIKIWKLLDLLKEKQSKLVLYNYDAFLFDISLNDGKQLIKDIKNILEEDGFPTEIKSGSNYSFK